MEVVGGVASFIAIGQAIAAIPKIIKAIKTVSNAREELQDLLFELTILIERYDHVKTTLRLFSPQDSPMAIAQEEPYYMKILRTRLEALLEQLQVLAKDCQALAEDPTPHVSFRAKWPWKRQKVRALYEEVKKVQVHLDAATRIFMDRTIHTQSKILIEIHAVTTRGRLPVPQNAQGSTSDTEYQPSEGSATDSTPGNLTPSGSSTSSEPPEYAPPGYSRLPPLGVKQRADDCECRCHHPVSRNKQLRGLSLVPGKLSVSHSDVNKWIFPCRKCKCGLSRATVWVDYQFPPWLLNRAVHFKASLDRMSGIGVSLRLPAVLNSTDRIWQVLRSPVVEDVQWFIASHGYTPTDADPQGGSIMEYAMTHNEYSNILFLLDRYTYILRDTTVASNAVMRARTKLYENQDNMSDFEGYTLNRVVELLDENVDASPLLLHQAVRGHGDLDSAMKTHASTINDLDDTGFTPLHLACLYDNFDALTYLIDADADVHVKDLQGDTPLHLAATRGQVEFVTALLDAGSEVNRLSRYGQTALDKALRSRNVTDDGRIVELLLMRGASIANADAHGYSSLHHLAGFKSGAAAAERCFELLMRAGAKAVLEARNQFDNTPLLDALWESNATVARLLLGAGARADASNIRALNILHAVARNGDREMMAVLRAARLSGPDVRSSAHNGLTPIGQFRHCMHAIRDRTNIVKDRKPSPEEVAAFEALLREIRDRGIVAEAVELEAVVADLERGDAAAAREALLAIAEKKEQAGIAREGRTFRAIALQVKQDLLEPAVESLREFMEVSRDRMKVSPFDEE